MPQKEAEIVKEWHEALNTNNSAKLLSLIDDNIKLAGPRGAAYGSKTLIDWMEKTHIKMIPLRYYTKGNSVVVEERVDWYNTETGEPKESYVIASGFVIRGEKTESIMRYNDLSEALVSEGLTEEDLITI